MSGSDVTPPRPRLSRTAALWLTIGIAVAAIIVIVVAVSLGNPGAPGPAGATSSPTPAATTPEPEAVPTGPATPGAAVPAPTAPAIPIDDTATPAPGVTVAVGAIESVAGEAERPGDVSGPAVRFTVTVTNSTAKAVSLASALVNLYYGADSVPASELAKPGGVPLPTSVAAGASVAGTFIFTVPENERDDVLITLDYQVGSPVIAFEGSVPS